MLPCTSICIYARAPLRVLVSPLGHTRGAAFAAPAGPFLCGIGVRVRRKPLTSLPYPFISGMWMMVWTIIPVCGPRITGLGGCGSAQAAHEFVMPFYIGRVDDGVGHHRVCCALAYAHVGRRKPPTVLLHHVCGVCGTAQAAHNFATPRTWCMWVGASRPQFCYTTCVVHVGQRKLPTDMPVLGCFC